MARRELEQIDPQTGEVLQGFVAVVQPKRKNGFGQGWVAMAQDAIGDEARRVFFLLAGHVDFDNWIQISQTDLADMIGMKRTNFSRALKRLEGEGVLLRGPKIGRSATFRLNPEYGWKGSAKSHKEALQERMRARGMTVIERDPNTVDWVNSKPDQGE